MTIYVTGPRTKKGELPPDIEVFNVTSRDKGVWQQLSPFLLGPCQLYWGLTSKNVENAWQYSKVYKDDRAPTHILEGWGNSPEVHDATIIEDWFRWALQGFAQDRAVRYPVGKGAKPLFSYWAGQRLDYLAARKLIYVPLYVLAANRTPAYAKLYELHNAGQDFALWDFDGRLGTQAFAEVLDDQRPLGHAFVLRAMLTEPEVIIPLMEAHQRTL